MTENSVVNRLAMQLRAAEADGLPIDPIASELGENNIAAAYAVQAEVTKRGIAAGRRLVGRKIGLTSKAVQQQLGVDQPDYGALFADMEVATGGEVQGSKLIQPRIEAEIAIVLDRDLSERDLTMGELMRAIAYVVPALENRQPHQGLEDHHPRHDCRQRLQRTLRSRRRSKTPDRRRSGGVRHGHDTQRLDRVGWIRSGLSRTSAQGGAVAGTGDGGRRKSVACRRRRADGGARARFSRGGRSVLRSKDFRLCAGQRPVCLTSGTIRKRIVGFRISFKNPTVN